MAVVPSSPVGDDQSQPSRPDPLLTLAPAHLPNFRKTRYSGDSLCVTLDQLAERDGVLLRDLYRVLSELLYTIADPATDDAEKWRQLALRIPPDKLDTVINEVRELGIASHEQKPGDELAKAMHDVRGGALSALLGRLQLLDRLPRNESQLKTIFVLLRDHLKIMRNAIVGLDEDRREADREPKSHGMKLMLEKWHDSIVGPNWQERPIRMSVNCHYDGALTECCLESAAVDRIFYNLANNACRHAVGDHIDMAIFPVPQPRGDCLRFVLTNEVGEEDASYLLGLASAGQPGNNGHGASRDLAVLFESEVSSTGSGFGLTVVAEFVAEAFGLRDLKEALRERYVGAMLDGRVFRVWFHWPMANEKLPPKLDDYHHPEQSLSEK